MSTDQFSAHAGARGPGRIDAQVRRIIIVVIVGSTMTVLDTTVVNVALESLSRDLHTTLGDVQWVVSAYLLSLAAVIPMTGWAASRYGTKRLYLASIVVFTLGSALCGLATSPAELIAFRVVQGVGGGMIVPIGQMILVKAAGPRNLARVMSVFTGTTVLAPVLGPTIGGLLLDSAGWRWIFYINVPIGALAVLIGLRRLPSDPPGDAGRFDLAGLGLVATGLVGVTYGLAEVGSSADALTHVIFPLVGGVVLLTAFAARALRMSKPLLDMRLYLNRSFSAASVTILGLGAVLFGGMILLPLYFQTVRHQNAIHTGLLLAPRGIGSATAAWLSGRMIDRVGAGFTAAVGALITVVAVVPFVLLHANTPYSVLSAILWVQGFGIGLTFPAAMTAAFRAVRPDQTNDASPQLNILMRVGGSIGSAILTASLQHNLSGAGASSSAQASAFAGTFEWVLAISVAAAVPAVALIAFERRKARDLPRPGEVTLEATARVAELE